MNLTPEEKLVGRDNYYEAVGVTRRDFMKSVVAAGAVSGAGLGAAYFSYGKVTDPVRVGVIGTGDEGSVLIGAINPEYMQVVAVSDIRPSSIHRAFHGDWGGGDPYFTHRIRPGLMQKYDWKTETEARKHVKVYDSNNGGWTELIKDPDVEAIVIATPLHLHHPIAIAAMKAGKHVMSEKLMAHTVGQCKEMAVVSHETGMLMATGHQRHYSVLYDNAKHLLREGLLGELQFIRAQWHRGNLPGRDSWEMPLPGGEKSVKGDLVDKIGGQLKSMIAKKKRMDEAVAAGRGVDGEEYELLERQIAQWTAWDADKGVKAEDHGYEDDTLPNGMKRSALEELVRWRLWERTGGGLMAELGSHQMDAASIFISALHGQDEHGHDRHVHPLTVHAIGGLHVFPQNRDAYDHVYCMFEFPAPGYEAVADPEQAFGYYDPVANYPDPKKGIPSYEKDANKKITVTYSSTMGNGFGGYGEVVMGSKGTLILEREQEVMLYKDSSTTTKVSVKKEGGGAVLDTQASGGGAGAPVAKAADSGPVSRGYTEELEHFAWCLRNNPKENQPRCYPEVALGDAVIAHVTRLAMRRANDPKVKEGGFVRFNKDWFDPNHPATPEDELKV